MDQNRGKNAAEKQLRYYSQDSGSMESHDRLGHEERHVSF